MARTGWGIGKKAADMLMDREIPEADRQKIIALVNADENILGMHDLRTWFSGTNIHISFDVEMNAELSLEKAHSISRDLEYSILKEFPNAEILIHIDPEGDTYDTRHKVHGVHH
jgi:ferrous-iron efflux pump FieF